MSKFLPTLFGTTGAALVIAGAGLWFAPNNPAHGQPNEDLAQQIDVTVVDDEGDPVVGAPISIERFDPQTGDWVSARRGGSSDLGGMKTIEMPTGQGSYRVVLTVPDDYTEWYDDADGNNPGPRRECAGMERRCVAYQVDAAGTVSLMQPSQGGNATAITFHVMDKTPEPRFTLTQFDTGGRAVPGGTVTLRPYTIKQVGNQNVRQWGRPIVTGVSTASRTFRVSPNTSYEVSWRPPGDYLRVSPATPFHYDVASPAKGALPLPFRVTLPTPPGDGNDSSGHLDPGGAHESVPGGGIYVPGGTIEQPAEPAPADENPGTAPAEPAPVPEQAQPEPTGSIDHPEPSEPVAAVPAEPVVDTVPDEPTEPIVAVPAEPTEPVVDTVPDEPTEPTEPIVAVPAEPTEPVVDTVPDGPIVAVPAEPTEPVVDTVPGKPTVDDPRLDPDFLDELAGMDPETAAEIAAEFDPELAATILEEAGIEAAGTEAVG